MANLEEVPAFIRIANDQTLMEMALIENIQRENLNPFEIAISYRRLKDEFALSDDLLAERVGKKRSTITNYLRLIDLHPSVIEALRNTTISMGHAKPIAAIKDKLLQNEFLKQVLEQGLNVREAEKLAKTYRPRKGKSNSSSKAKLGSEHQLILKDFKEFFGTSKISMELEDQTSEKGKIIIEFKDNEQLNFFYKCVEQM